MRDADVQHDDDSLMLRIAAGDEAAFRQLVARWEQQLYAFSVHMLGSGDEAQDLVQDTFLKVFDQARRYRPEGRFRSWLLRIAGNKARSAQRRRKVLRWVTFDLADHDQASPGDDPGRSLEREETAERVRAAVDALPDRQREAVLLKRFHDLSYQEIAEVLETTVPAVESLLQRAAAGLRQDLSAMHNQATRKDTA